MQKYKLKMRTYKFRGKSKEKIKFLNLEVGSFVYGDLLHDENSLPMIRVHCEIQPDYMEPPEPTFYDIEVDPKSVGQCVNIEDTNEVMVYENDIVAVRDLDWEIDRPSIIGIITYSGSGFALKVNGSYNHLWVNAEVIEVVGNGFDTLELIKKEVA